MSITAKLDRLSLDLHNVSQQSSPIARSKPTKKSSLVAESWEDEPLSDEDIRSPLSDASIPLEAPGPDIKSPTTRAIDAEKELAGDFDDINTPPPTPLSPQAGSYKTDWSPATTLGGGRPTYSPTSTTSSMDNNASGTPRATPLGSTTPVQRYPTPTPIDTTRDRDQERKRPEKTTATANRLIAGALGIKAPPKTEEQRRYERAVKEQEIKRKNREKEERKKAEEDDEKAKAAVWGA